ncbi:hypothetical protein BKA81DRAFT_364821 [Phyllosticta paracitricarpa]
MPGEKEREGKIETCAIFLHTSIAFDSFFISSPALQSLSSSCFLKVAVYAAVLLIAAAAFVPSVKSKSPPQIT